MRHASRLHPLLLAASPIIFLYAHNWLHCTLAELISWLAIAIAATGLPLVVCIWRLTRPDALAALLSCGVALFIVYGHLFDLCWNPALFPRMRYLHAVLLVGSGAVFAAAGYGLLRTRRDLAPLNKALTAGASIFLLLSLAVLARNGLQRADVSQAVAEVSVAATTGAEPSPSANPPDIYFLILDGYARADVLREFYGFDNEPFLDYLRHTGFYIAERSCANYHQTRLSLSATLHLRYHEDAELKAPSNLRLFGMIHRPLAAELLKAHGYRYVHMRTEWAGTRESPLADESLNAPNGPLSGYLAFSLHQTTMVRLLDGLTIDYGNSLLETFRNLPSVAAMDGPTFTFAHVIAPHPPYVFDRLGRRRSDLDQRTPQSYVDQLAFVNSQVQKAVDQILARSANPPIIIIQSDHGAGYFCDGLFRDDSRDDERYVRERLPILNAMLVPAAMRERLYPTISPVNTFRLLLSSCFDQPYELLPDRQFVGLEMEPEIREVTHLWHDGLPRESMAGSFRAKAARR